MIGTTTQVLRLGDAGPSDGLRRRARLAAWLRQCSIETSARTPAEVEGYRGLLPPGTEVYVAALPDRDPYGAIAVSARLAAMGYAPVPHLAARQFVSFTQAREIAQRLAGEAGVTQVLVIGGDQPRPAGPYDAALALLEIGILPRAGIRRVGFAGHPEGNPRIGAAELGEALRRKVAAAESAGLAPYIVSQFCFEADIIVGWLRALRRDGIAAPVRIGLAGRAGVRTLLQYALRCGVGASVRALGTHAASLLHLATESGPEPVLGALVERIEDSDGVAGIHFFPFGGFETTAHWLASVRRDS